MLSEYSDILLQVIAELRGAFLDAADSRRQAIELLASQISEPTSVLMAHQDLIDFHQQAEGALNALLEANGEMTEAQFVRDFGGVRKMGPARLERETPWMHPESVSELLYYYGMVGLGFKGTGREAQSIVYIPSDVLPWLPRPANPNLEGGMLVTPVPPPPKSRILAVDDTFLEDAGSLIGFLHTEELRLMGQAPHSEDVARLIERFYVPYTDTAEFDIRLALLLHLTKQLGWLRVVDNPQGERVVQLTNNKVRAFLEKSRAEQRLALWECWRDSVEWNDLCRTPGLECVDTGSWRNDPLQTRASVLRLVGQLQPGLWYSLADIQQIIKAVDPDFQRPSANYDTWYIRSTSTQEFIKGFDNWERVEGTLLSFLLTGPLHWLGATDLAEPSAGDDIQLSLSQWGAIWLGHNTVQPSEVRQRPFKIKEDFTITLPAGVSLLDRFRVERFAQWQSSYPNYVYQISQRSLARGAGEGISAQQILQFLTQHSQSVPAKVQTALERFTS